MWRRGEEALTQANSEDRKSGNVVLRLSGLEKSFGSIKAVENVELAVQHNELVTLLGPSGCGKTTTLRMVAGFEFPTSGQIAIDGKDVTFDPPNKREIGIVFQSYSLFPHLSIADNVAYGLKRRGVPKLERNQRMREALELVDLGQFGNRFPSELSGGQQQRVALARAIVIRPKILLLDEPLSALDAKLRERMRSEIRRLQRQIGMTTVMVTHDQEEALAMSDRIVVMNKGKVEQIGSPAEIYQNPKTPFVASFIGETNLFEGHIVSSDEGPQLAHFQASCGFEASINNRETFKRNERVLISLRPESLLLSEQENFAEGARNVIRGVIRGINYLGARTMYEIATPSRELIVSVQNDIRATNAPSGRFSEGQTVAVSWTPEACQVVEAS